ncbi:MAG: CusA/CzcA family heavy metal efflux RND transporter [Bacteroidetes bacterium]|nr:CusA/CzcA family heavy metal efflux RND transporter [Bacteroidota bacterium]
MLNKIIEFSVRNKLIIGLMLITLIGYGSYQATQLPIDAVPDITNNQVQVITVAPSFGATDIERLVTFPIEQANSNIPGTLEIRSFSRFGLSLVTIVFDDDTDVYWARQQVAERLQKVQTEIPAGIGTPELGPVSSGLGEIYQYVVRPQKGFESQYDATELRTLQDWVVRRQLLGVQGVAEVSSFGGKLKQYEIAVNPNKLNALGLTISDVFTAVEANNQNTGGAYIEKGGTSLFIRSEGLIGSVEDINNIRITPRAGNGPIFLRDVAEVRIGNATRYGAMCYNDQGEVSGAVVMMLKGANSSQVIKNVKERIAQIQKTLPKGVVIEPFLDRTKMVNNAIGTVEKNLLEGALIVVFVLVLFLGNFRAGLLVASVIPLAMLFAIIMMNLFGVSGNLMSLGALDFGLIVDGAVIIVEAVMHQLTHSKKFVHINQLDQNQMDQEVKTSAGKMMNSAVFGQIIILIVYLPIFTLEGIEGKMFIPMAQTVAFALLGAFILSLTYIPMMSSVFLSKKIQHEPNKSDLIMAKIERHYQHYLQMALNHSKAILATVIGLFVLAVGILTMLGGEFIPALEEGDFAVDTRVLTGSNLNTTIESTQKAAHILKSRFPEVEKVVCKIGSGEVPTDPMPMEASDMMVILKDKSEWTSAKTFNELSEKMSQALTDVPGITAGFQYPVQMRFNELMTGARQDVVCKIFGENLDTLSTYAQKLGKIVSTVQGAQNLYVESVTGMPQIIIQYNRSTIAQYGLSIEEINRAVHTAFAGQSTGLVFEGEKRFDLVVRLGSEQRQNLEDVQNLLIATASGTQIPLSQLARVSIENGPNQIQREDAKRRIIVGFNVRGRDVQSIVAELQSKVDKKLSLPAGYYVTYGGAFENLNKAKARLMIAVPVSLILIFLLLFFAFKSVRQGLLIYSAIPLSAIGGIIFLALRGMPFSISAGVGFIALFGVAVLNGIVLIAEFNQLKSEGMKDLHRIVLMGTKVRLRPVLMTAFVASLGFLPMALSNGAGAEVQRPLATVVIGGLMIATFLTLFVLPILYVLFEAKSEQKSGKVNVSAIIVFLILLPNLSPAQSQKINLEQSIELALKNNSSVKLERLRADYQQKLIKTSTNLPMTNISGEYGQINSYYNDNRLSIAQSLSFPTVYNRQKKYYTEASKLATIKVQAREARLKKEVTETFYGWLFWHEKEQLLLKSDSLFAAFERKSELRFKKGESNVLEKATAQTQRGSIQMQLSEVRREKDRMLQEFDWLLCTDTIYIPTPTQLKISNTVVLDSLGWQNHTEVQWAQQQKATEQAATRVEKSKLLPELTFGYNNMTMQGTGSNNVLYDRNTRFQSGQIGLGIPLLGGAGRARVAAAKIQERIADQQYESEKVLWLKQYKNAQADYKTALDKLKYFEGSALTHAEQMTKTADVQFLGGDINYLQWVQIIHQSIGIQSDYLDAVMQYNRAVTELNYLNSK